LSWFVHSGNAGYAGLSESSLEWVYGISMNISRKMYIEALEMCAKTFSLNHTINGFSQVIESLKNAPEKILIDHGLRKSRDRDDGA
jgi:hypothetical protein